MIIDENTKIQLMKMQITTKSSTDEQQFKTPISENIDKEG